MTKDRLRNDPPETGLAWVPADPDLFSPGHVFLSRGWFQAKWPGGAYRPLELRDGGSPAGGIAVRCERRAGLFERWEVLAEPVINDARISQAQALEALIRLARINGVDLIDSYSNMARWTDPRLADLLAAGESEPFGTYVLDLSRDLRQIREAMHSEHRRLLRKAEAAGLEIRDSVPAEAFVRLLDETYGRGGKRRPFDARYLRRLIEAPLFERIIASAWLDDRLEAAVIVPFAARRGYFLHGASRSQPAPGATVAVQIAAAARLQAAGVREYDLGGARRETPDARLQGIFRFKQRLGGKFEDCRRWRLPLTRRGRVGLALARRCGRL